MYGRLIALWLACATGEPEALAQPPEGAQESSLQTTIQLAEARVADAKKLKATVTITNAGSAPSTVNLLLAPYPSVALEVRDASGQPVPKSPPPVPPIDSGQGQKTLAPGESVSFDYAGSQLFGMRLAAGAYELRFRVGDLASDWARFEVAP